MKIADQEIENLNVSVILEKLKELPPSLPELAEINKSKNIALSEEDMELWQKRDDVLDLLEVVEGRSQSEIFNEACQLGTLYNKLIERTKQNVVFTTETNCLAINQSHAILCLVELKNYMGKAYSSIEEYTKAIKSYYENSGTLDTFIQESVKKLQTTCTSQEELKIRYGLGAVAYAKKDYNAIIENYNRILFLKPNLSDTEALAVGQAEVGFSSV
jgi:tetratricopeptide (TPR) repeat protein